MSTDTPANPSVAPVTQTAQVGRNEPCPCGSQKKYKRCCGQDAAPKLSTPSAAAMPSMNAGGMPGGAGMPPGMENVDPALMSQATQALQRLPRPQLQKLQSLMQRAMAGKDVSQEAAAFEKMLPPEFQSMMQGLAMQMGGMGALGGGMPGMPTTAPVAEETAFSETSTGDMSIEEAKKIIEAAASSGKISGDEAEKLLQVEAPAKTSGGMGKFWRGLTGKK